jgi:ribosomal protein L16 Arg81 hydroxylase
LYAALGVLGAESGVTIPSWADTLPILLKYVSASDMDDDVQDPDQELDRRLSATQRTVDALIQGFQGKHPAANGENTEQLLHANYELRSKVDALMTKCTDQDASTAALKADNLTLNEKLNRLYSQHEQTKFSLLQAERNIDTLKANAAHGVQGPTSNTAPPPQVKQIIEPKPVEKPANARSL